MLTQQVELNDVRLEIGIVTDAQFVRETIAELDHAPHGAAAPPEVQPTAPTTDGDGETRADAVAAIGRAVADHKLMSNPR